MPTTHADRLAGYLNLIEQSYPDAVATLQHQHGAVTDDYFSKASYDQFLTDETKLPSAGHYSKLADGLITHHVAEDQFEKLDEPQFIQLQHAPFDVQQRDLLVYCDAFEHLILHALIMKQTRGQFGGNDFATVQLPAIQSWYLKGATPDQPEQQAVKQRAELTPEETKQVLHALDDGPLYVFQHIEKRMTELADIFKNDFADRWHKHGVNPQLGLETDRTFLQLRANFGVMLENQLFEDFGSVTDDWLREQIEAQFEDYLYPAKK